MSILEDKIPMSDLHPLLQYHKLARLLSSDVRNPSKYFDEIGMTSIEYIEDWGPWCPMAAFWPAEEYPYWWLTNYEDITYGIYHWVYGTTFRRVMRTVPRVVIDSSTTESSRSTPPVAISFSSSLSSSSSFFFFLGVEKGGIWPRLKILAAERRKSKISNWLERIFLSWSAIPLPIRPVS